MKAEWSFEKEDQYEQIIRSFFISCTQESETSNRNVPKEMQVKYFQLVPVIHEGLSKMNTEHLLFLHNKLKSHAIT